MNFNGFQKLTLLDFPQKVACTLFTAGCNFRCPFCHNASLVTEIDNSETYSDEEVLKFLSTRTGLLDGVCITGGEPLMHKDIVGFAQKVKELGFAVKLDTNGSYPELLKDLVAQNLVDYVAMDIKNSKEMYGKTIGIENFDITPVEQSVEFLQKGNVDYEFRTTVVKQFHSEKSIDDLAKWIKGCPKFYLQNFVDSGNLIGTGICGVDRNIMETFATVAKKHLAHVELRGI